MCAAHKATIIEQDCIFLPSSKLEVTREQVGTHIGSQKIGRLEAVLQCVMHANWRCTGNRQNTAIKPEQHVSTPLRRLMLRRIRARLRARRSLPAPHGSES